MADKQKEEVTLLSALRQASKVVEGEWDRLCTLRTVNDSRDEMYIPEALRFLAFNCEGLRFYALYMTGAINVQPPAPRGD